MEPEEEEESGTPTTPSFHPSLTISIFHKGISCLLLLLLHVLTSSTSPIHSKKSCSSQKKSEDNPEQKEEEEEEEEDWLPMRQNKKCVKMWAFPPRFGRRLQRVFFYSPSLSLSLFLSTVYCRVLYLWSPLRSWLPSPAQQCAYLLTRLCSPYFVAFRHELTVHYSSSLLL